MKILSVNNTYFIRGGADRYFFEVTKLQEAKGDEVIPFSVQNKKNFNSPYSDYFVSDIDFFGPKRLLDYPRIAERVLYSFEAKRKIHDLVKEVRPRIAHLHAISHGISPSILDALRKYNIPVVQTLLSMEMMCPTWRMYANGQLCDKCRNNRFYHSVLNRCNRGLFWASLLCCIKGYLHRTMRAYEKNVDIFIAPSRFMERLMIEHGFDSKKVVHAPLFVDVKRFQPSQSNSGYFVYFGRLDETKGLMTLLEATKKVRGPKLYIIGEGRMRGELERFVGNACIENVRFLGHLPDDSMASVVREAMFTVVPSEWYELFGLVIAESFAWGKPVIGSRLGAVPELIDDGEDGLLFEPGNADDLAEKIRHLIDNQHLLGEMGRRAREKVEIRYNPQLHYQRLMDIYRSVIR